MIQSAPNIAERNVIGSIMIDPWGALPKVRAILTPDDFTDRRLREVFMAACRVADKGMPTEWSIVSRDIMRAVPAAFRDIRDVGRCCHNDTPVSTHIEYYARLMIEDAYARVIAEVSSALADNPSSEVADTIVGRLQQAKARVAALDTKHKAMVEGQLRETTFEYLEAKERDLKGGCGNVPTPLRELDSFIGGPLPLGSYVILGGCSGNGKTLFVLQLLRNAAKIGHACTFYSLEMSATAVGERLASMAHDGNVQKANAAELMRDVDEWLDGNVIFRQCESTVTALLSDMERMRTDHGITVFAIDYLGLIRGPGKDRYQQMTHINAAIKTFASQHNVTVVMCCQLNRAVMNQHPPIPQKHHLRDSGEIEASADAIFLLRYPIKDTAAHELKTQLAEDGLGNVPPEEVLEIYCPKLRNRQAKGECFTCRLKQSPLRLAPLIERHERTSEDFD